MASRSELLSWINTNLDAGYTRIEQCGNGAIYCLIFDQIYPGKIPLSRVHQSASEDHQILHNYKLLQMGFNKVGITREVPVEKLMRFKLQDNLEFLQWFYRQYNHNGNGGVRLPSAAATAAASAKPTANPTAKSLSTNRNAVNTRHRDVGGVGGGVGGEKKPVRRVSAGRTGLGGSAAGRLSSSRTGSAGTLAKLKEELAAVTERLEESEQVKDSLETERNFYFNKLREIEVIFQNLQEKVDESADTNSDPDVSLRDLLANVLGILYSTEDGFSVPDEELQQQQQQDVQTPLQTPEGKENLILDEETF